MVRRFLKAVKTEDTCGAVRFGKVWLGKVWLGMARFEVR